MMRLSASADRGRDPRSRCQKTWRPLRWPSNENWPVCRVRGQFEKHIADDLNYRAPAKDAQLRFGYCMQATDSGDSHG